MSKTPEQIRDEGDVKVLKVAAGSEVGKVAGAIVKFMQEGRKVELSAIGAGAVNQAIKAVAVARGMAATHGNNLYCIPSFSPESFHSFGGDRGDQEFHKTGIRIAIHNLKL